MMMKKKVVHDLQSHEEDHKQKCFTIIKRKEANDEEECSP
jgi:hypothetical protein